MGLIFGKEEIDARWLDGVDVDTIDPYYDFPHSDDGPYDLEAHRRVPVKVQKDDSDDQITKAIVRIRRHDNDLPKEEATTILKVVRGGEQNWYVPSQHVDIMDQTVFFEKSDSVLLSFDTTRLPETKYKLVMEFPEATFDWSEKDTIKIRRVGFWRAQYRGAPIDGSTKIDPAFIYVRSKAPYLPVFLGEGIPIVTANESLATQVMAEVQRADCPVTVLTPDTVNRFLYKMSKKVEDQISLSGLENRGLKTAATEVLKKAGVANWPAKLAVLFVDALIKASGDDASMLVCYTWDMTPFRWSPIEENYVPDNRKWPAVAAIAIIDKGDAATGIRLTSVEPVWRIFKAEVKDRQFDVEPWLEKSIYSRRPKPGAITSRFFVVGTTVDSGTALPFPKLRPYQTGLTGG